MTSLGAVRRGDKFLGNISGRTSTSVQTESKTETGPDRSISGPDRPKSRGIQTETGPDRHISRPDRPKTEAQTSVGLGRSKFRPVGPGRPQVAEPTLD